MPVFSSIMKLKSLNELQVNGQQTGDNDDFTINTNNTQQEPDTIPSNTPDNNQEVENNNQSDEETSEDDFTLDDEDNLDDTEAEEDNPEQNSDDKADDFTVDGNDTSNNDTDANEENEKDNSQTENDSNEDQKSEQPEIGDEDIKSAEEAIYDSLTDDQKRIRILQLKVDFKDLYETILTTLDSINNIPKTDENLETIKRLILFLTKARNILIDYISNNFDKSSYLENYTIYIKYMAMFRTTARVLDELSTEKK